MAVAIARDAMQPLPFLIERVTQDVSDTFTLVLRPQYGTEAFPFAPGQFNMLYLFGVGEVPVSISGDPEHPERLVHTIRALGSVTSGLQRLKKGGVVGVRGPFGSAWPVGDAVGADVLIVAGGVGLAPLRPAIHAILAKRGQYGRLVILYGARTPRDILYRRELQRWGSGPDTFVDVTVDRAPGDWHGNVGVVTTLIGHGGFEPEHTIGLVCGPEVMIRYAVQALADRGMSHQRIYISMERNMKCAVGFCGHCQWGGTFVCRDGPVFRFDNIAELFRVREL